jgi:dolichol kinase
MKFKDSRLYSWAGGATMIVSAGLFFWKVLPFAGESPGLVFATTSILCMVSAGILFVLYLDARLKETGK